MINKKYLKLQRIKNKLKPENFIYDKISKRIVDSIDLINGSFNNIIEIGINDNLIFNYLLGRFPKSNIHRADIINNLDYNSDKNIITNFDLDNWNLQNDSYDLIYSNSFLHLSENIDEVFNNIKSSLKKDGFFIGTIPDLDNAFQLVNSMIKNDIDIYDGVFQRINPTLNIDNILKILKKLNLNIPTIHSEFLKIEYNNFSRLLHDVQQTSLSYCYNDKKNNFENKQYFRKLEEIYKKEYTESGNFILDIRFNIISFWKLK